MKCLLIYQSKSGYTKRYMEMLSEQMDAMLLDLKSTKPAVFSEFDTIVYAGGVYAGKISGIKKFFKYLGNRNPQKVAVVAVGASPSTPEVKEKLEASNLTHEVITGGQKPEFFYLQGGFDPNKLSFPLKTMLGMVSKGLKSKELKNPDSLTQGDREFLEFFQSANDQTSAQQLDPLLGYLRSE